jgi:hypothetical protein
LIPGGHGGPPIDRLSPDAGRIQHAGGRAVKPGAVMSACSGRCDAAIVPNSIGPMTCDVPPSGLVQLTAPLFGAEDALVVITMEHGPVSAKGPSNFLSTGTEKVSSKAKKVSPLRFEQISADRS